MSESTNPATTTNTNCCASQCDSKPAANVSAQPQAAAPAPATPKPSKRQRKRQ